jgi:hypothetical protein
MHHTAHDKNRKCTQTEQDGKIRKGGSIQQKRSQTKQDMSSM